LESFSKVVASAHNLKDAFKLRECLEQQGPETRCLLEGMEMLLLLFDGDFCIYVHECSWSVVLVLCKARVQFVPVAVVIHSVIFSMSNMFVFPKRYCE
jgi:hypothetical protein